MSKEKTFDRDRNLLFGVIAVQMHFIEPIDLAKAAAIFVTDPSRDLGGVLQDLGLIRLQDHDLIEALLARKLADHDGDATATLASFGGKSAVEQSFSGSIVVVDSQHLSLALESFGGSQPISRIEDLATDLLDEARITLEHPGRYYLQGEHGRGAIGRIVLARDRHLGREIAVKELLQTGGHISGANFTPGRMTAESRARFLREARITGQLEHPSIVPVYELGQRSDGTIYYTMRLVRGKSLADLLRECKSPFDRLQLLPHFIDVCHAMAYAHSKGVIHRDLKPQNVVVGEFGETIVLDWGLAKMRGIPEREERQEVSLEGVCADGTVPGAPMGTPSYMSPEQAEGNVGEVDERSDVWGLGAILYELLTGRPPFTGVSAMDVICKVIGNEVRPAAEVEPEAPPELCEIVHRCLRKDRGLRFPNATQLAEVVAQVLLGLFGPVSFIRVRAERNLAVEQKLAIEEQRKVAEEQRRIAEEQRALARQREEEARRNLSEAFLQYGLQAEREARHCDAALFFGKTLELSGRDEARSGLYRESVQPVALALDRVLPGHLERISTLCFSPDGRHLLSGGWDEILKLWSTETGDCLREFAGHQDWIPCATFTPDGARILAGSQDAVNVWDVATGALHRRLIGHESQVMAIAVHPDGAIAASGSVDQTVRLWSLTDGAELRVLAGHNNWVTAVDFSPDGRYLVSGSWDETIRLWDVTSGECLGVFEGHRGEVNWVGFDPDSRFVLSAANDETLRMWDTENGTCLHVFRGHVGRVFNAAIHPGGEFIISGGDDFNLRLHSLEPTRPLTSFLAHDARVSAVAVSPDGRLAASGSWDRGIKVWRVERNREEVSLDQDGEVCALAFARSGRRLAFGGEGRMIAVWSPLTSEYLQALAGHSGRISALAFTPDSRIASASWDNTLRLWDPLDPDACKIFRGHQEDILSLAVSPDGRNIITGGYDGSIKLWDTEGNCLRDFEGHQSPVASLAFRRDGRHFLSGSAGARSEFEPGSGEVRLWSVDQVESISVAARPPQEVTAVACSPNGRTAAAGSLESVTVFNIESGETLGVYTGHFHWVRALAFSPDGNYIASVGDDKLLHVWRAGTRETLLRLAGHRDPILAVAFDPAGDAIATAGKDGIIRMWPFSPALLEPTGAELFESIQQRFGLRLDGFRVVLRQEARPEEPPQQEPPPDESNTDDLEPGF